MTCPICEHTRMNCTCGYDFDTGDVTQAHALARTHVAKNQVYSRLFVVTMLAAIPITALAALVYPPLWVTSLMILLLAPPVFASRIRSHQDAFHRMQRAERLMLPPARLV